VDVLEKENESLRMENAILKQEIMRLRTIIHEVNYTRSLSIPTSPPVPTHWNPFQTTSPRALKTTGTFLFVLFFSFMLFRSSPLEPVDVGMAHPHSASRILLGLPEIKVTLNALICKLPYIASSSLCQLEVQRPPSLIEPLSAALGT
jgi:hypothetical protein